MFKILFKTLNKQKIALFIFTLSIVLFLCRTTNPFIKYPFLLIYIILGIYIFINYKFKIVLILKDCKNYYYIILLLLLYFILSCFFSDKIYLVIIKDLISIIILLTLVFAFKILIKDRNDFKLFFNLFLLLIIFISSIISLIQISNYLYNSTYENSNLFNIIPFVIDNNFALLPVFFGMISIYYIFLNEISIDKKIFYNLLLFIFSINTILSGSSRGFILFLFIYVFILIIHIFGFFNKKIKKSFIRKNSFYYIISFTLVLFLTYLTISCTSVYVKNEILRKIGVKNISFAKVQITATLFKYVHIFDKNITGDSLYQKIWNPIFDPKDPDAGWANRNYKIVQNLIGNNVEIVPKGVKGYLLDSSCFSLTSGNHAYYFNIIKSDKINVRDSIVASVYCYVSNDFNGDAAAIRADGSLINNPDKWYDLKNKGSWQKLVLPFSCSNGNLSIYLYINKLGVTNFSNLKGYVIFAYPEYYILSKDTLTVKPYKKINILNNNIIEKNEINYSKLTTNSEFIPSNYKSSASIIFIKSNNILTLFTLINVINDKDPIRNWIAKIISEDTTYYGYKTNFKTDTKVVQFGDDRFLRWKFAIEIFTKEYSWSQKIFGGGFNFLNWYGYYFDGDKTKSDYPHNPFLYILLYSGIIGLLLYIYLLYMVFYYYIKYIKEYYLFFIFFLITFFFTFFSGGNPFDPPTMGFFVILPFFIHYIHTVDNGDTINKEDLEVEF